MATCDDWCDDNLFLNISPRCLFYRIINHFFSLADGIFRILYEEVDETDVGIVKFPSFNGEAGGMEEYR